MLLSLLEINLPVNEETELNKSEYILTANLTKLKKKKKKGTEKLNGQHGNNTLKFLIITCTCCVQPFPLVHEA